VARGASRPSPPSPPSFSACPSALFYPSRPGARDFFTPSQTSCSTQSLRLGRMFQRPSSTSLLARACNQPLRLAPVVGGNHFLPAWCGRSVRAGATTGHVSASAASHPRTLGPSLIAQKKAGGTPQVMVGQSSCAFAPLGVEASGSISSFGWKTTCLAATSAPGPSRVFCTAGWNRENHRWL